MLVFSAGQAFAFTLPGAAGAAGGGEGEGSLLSPMPGRIISVDVRQGDTVAKGQKLVTLEAREGAQVTEGELLVRVEKGES